MQETAHAFDVCVCMCVDEAIHRRISHNDNSTIAYTAQTENVVTMRVKENILNTIIL